MPILMGYLNNDSKEIKETAVYAISGLVEGGESSVQNVFYIEGLVRTLIGLVGNDYYSLMTMEILTKMCGVENAIYAEHIAEQGILDSVEKLLTLPAL
jgi:hypothetical protein